MFRIVASTVLLVTAASISLAQEVPSLVGTWTGTITTITMADGRSVHETVIEITEQEGATFDGRTEWGDLVGAIAPDGRTVHWVDDDGWTTGTVTPEDTMEMCYIEVADEQQVSCWVARREP